MLVRPYDIYRRVRDAKDKNKELSIIANANKTNVAEITKIYERELEKHKLILAEVNEKTVLKDISDTGGSETTVNEKTVLKDTGGSDVNETTVSEDSNEVVTDKSRQDMFKYLEASQKSLNEHTGEKGVSRKVNAMKFDYKPYRLGIYRLIKANKRSLDSYNWLFKDVDNKPSYQAFYQMYTKMRADIKSGKIKLETLQDEYVSSGAYDSVTKIVDMVLGNTTKESAADTKLRGTTEEYSSNTKESAGSAEEMKVNIKESTGSTEEIKVDIKESAGSTDLDGIGIKDSRSNTKELSTGIKDSTISTLIEKLEREVEFHKFNIENYKRAIQTEKEIISSIKHTLKVLKGVIEDA